MSEEQKPARSIDQISGEYQNGCARAGHLQYQIFTLQNDLDLVNSSLRDLNLEAAAIKAKEAQSEQKAEEQSK